MLKYKLIKVTINAFNSLIIIFVILIDKVIDSHGFTS